MSSGLRRPGGLPSANAAAPVDVIETHASVVFLAGDRAWKLKKHVDLGFLNFTTLEARRRNCEEELRLNRRFAPEIYLGVWPVLDDHGVARVVRDAAAHGEIVDWVVEMRRLPAEGMLDRVLAAGGPSIGQIDDFANDIARFHASAATGGEVDEYGRVERVERRLDGNLARLAQYAPLNREFVQQLSTAAKAWLARIASSLEARRRAGRVRELHGDLHARNCCIVDGRIMAYDCLEFDPAFRCADVACELGFFAMDLDARGRSDLAERFVTTYADASHDDGVRAVERFFRMHYAVIRAMVDSIRLGDAALAARERDDITSMVKHYAALAAGYVVEPALVFMAGLPATGKSTMARSIAQPLRAAIVRTDELRKQLAGLAPTARGGAALYTEDHTRATYAEACDATNVHLRQGRSVVIDAANLRHWQRAAFIAGAEAHHVPWLLVETAASDSAIRERMASRSADANEMSDATFEVYELLRASREPLDDVPEARHVRVEPAGISPNDAVLAVMERLLTSRAAMTAASLVTARSAPSA